MRTLLERLERMPLARRLQLGFGGILLLVVLLGVYSLVMSRQQLERVGRLYDMDLVGMQHVETARAALADIGQSLRQAILMESGEGRVEALRQFSHADVLLRQEIELARPLIYRGAIKHSLREFDLAFADYRNQAITTSVLLRDGREAEASTRMRSREFQRSASAAREALERIATQKRAGADREVAIADQGYRDGARTTLALLVAAVITGVLFGVLVSRSIRRPADVLLQEMDSLSTGNLDASIPFTDYGNEAGELARAIETLQAQARQTLAQRWVKTQLAAILGELQAVSDPSELANRFFIVIAPLLDVGRAVFYVHDNDGILVRQGGYADEPASPRRVALGEGLVGQCAADRRTIVLAPPPADYLRVTSALGSAAPVQVLVLPLSRRKRLLGVIELATLSTFDSAQRELLDEVLPLLAMNLEIVERTVRTRQLLDESRRQEELTAQQAASLKEQTAALETQQKTIRAAKAWYRGIIESAPDGMMIVGQDGRILMCNPKLEAIFGYARDELAGSLVERLVPHASGARHVELRRAFFGHGVSRQMGTANADLRGVRKDGTELSVEIGLSFLPELEGQGTCVCASVRDVSQRRAMEVALQQSEERLRYILDRSPVCMGVATNDEIRFANPKFVETFGLTVGDAPQRIYVDPADRERVRGALANSAGPITLELKLLDRARRERDVLGTYLAIDYDGEPGLLAWFIDVTDQMAAQAATQRARELAEDATQAKSRFLANMSHEIRTPMNAIIGMSYLALQLELPTRQRNYVEKIHRSAGNLLGIINDILDLSKIEAGQMEVERVAFDLRDVLEHVSSVAGINAEQKGLELVYRLPAGLPTSLIGDPLRLGQILLNLTNNAIKFSERGAVVLGIEPVLVTGDGPVELHAWVKDEGIGMSEEQVARLFQSFVQGDASTTRRFGGTGLGLAISQRLAGLMGGGIQVESAPGVGSTFHLRARLGVDGDVSSTLADGAMRGARALVVDDSEVACGALVTMARGLGLEAEGATRVLDALRIIAQRGPYQVLLLDWNMAEIDGIDTLRRIAATATVAPDQVILTAYDPDEAQEEASRCGLVHGHALGKPVTPWALREAMAVSLLGRVPAPDGTKRARRKVVSSLVGSRVLLVEDNDLNRELAQDLLRRAGVEVVWAGNGQEALEILDDDPFFDGVLMDCQMPVMDGYEATRAIRTKLGLVDIPIIAMTASAMAGDRDEAIAAGMNDHIAKPIDVDAMLATMARWMETCDRMPLVRTEPARGSFAATPLAGIDEEAGLATCASNPVLYRRLLSGFVRDYSDFGASFSAAGASGDANAQRRCAHNLRGTAACIGAREVAEHARLLEEACETGASPERIEALVERTSTVLRPVLDGLMALDDSTAA